MKKMSLGLVGFCSFCLLFAFAAPAFAQDVYTLPAPESAANVIAAMKAQALSFRGLEIESSKFLPGTTTPNYVVEVVFKFLKPEEEGGGIFDPWLVAIFPLEEDALIADFVVQKRFRADYDMRYGLKGDPRVHDRLKEFLQAVYARLDEPKGP